MTPASTEPRPRATSASRRALAALGLLLVLGTVAASPASAVSDESLVTIRSTTIGGDEAPVTVVVHTEKTATVRISANGHVVAGAFGRAGTRRHVAHLALRDGLRAGTNRLVITARTAAGVRDVDVRTVRLHAARLLADAGRDRTLVVGRSVQVGRGAPKRLGTASYRWRLVDAPKGARATLRGATRARPVVTPTARGTYRLRLTTTTGSGAVAHDSLDLHALPNDPPTGVKIQTLAGGSGPQITIGGQGVPDVGQDDNGIYIAVLERQTRAIVQDGTAPRDQGGVNLVRRIAASWAAKGDYLVVLSGSNGVPATGLDELDGFLSAVGGAKLPATDRAKLAAGSPFSIVGDTNAPAGSAWVNIPAKRDGVPSDRTRAAANLSGSLVRSDVTDRYDYVENDVPHFSTRADRSLADWNRMLIAGKPHDGRLPAGHREGFHIVALDQQSLDVVYEDTLPTDGPGLSDRGAGARNLARGLEIAARERGQTIVLVQSIGNPLAATPDWTQASAWIENLGGDARQFNSLDGTKAYALVGSLASPETAVQASTVAGTGDKLDGTFGRSRSHGFEPMLAASTGASDQGLVDIVNQTSEGFPAFDTAGLKAAQTWFAKKLRLCDDACDIRRLYWEQYRADWNGRYTNLLSLRADGFPSGQSDFTKADWDTVVDRLAIEIGYLLDSRTYFDALAKPFGAADTQAIVDVQALGKQLYDSVQPPPQSSTTSYWLTLTGKIVSVVGAAATVFPPAGATLSAIGAGFALMGYLTQPNGAQVGGEILTRADGFQQEVLNRLRSAQDSLQFAAVQIASDWGKLQAVQERLKTSDPARKWAIAPTDARTRTQLRRALQQWMAEALVPVAYTKLAGVSGIVKSLPFDKREPSEDVRDLRCVMGGFGGRPYPDVPLSAQLPTTTGFNADGSPRRETFIVIHDRGAAMPSSLDDLLYNAPDANPPGLGVNPWSFNSARLFDVRHISPQFCETD